MTTETIALRESTLSLDGGIARFTHQRPERRNPMSMELRQDYVAMLDRIEGDPAVKALVIAGSGGVFCAGGDLKSLKSRIERPDAPENSPEAARRRLLNLLAWFNRLRNLDIPVIASVDGPAVGAGLSLALAADFVLASSRSFFSMSFLQVGLVPDMAATYLLPRVVGMAKAKDLTLTGRRFGPQEAQALGIVHSIYPHEDLERETQRFAARFAQAPAAALGPAKRMLNASFESSFATMAEIEGNAQAVATTTAWHAQALRRFAAGEPSLYDWERAGASG